MNTSICLTVLFEDPFWVGIFERNCGNTYEAAKVTFGAEPKDYEVYDFILKNFNHIKFSIPIKNSEAVKRKINPKRMTREIQHNLQNKGIGTKAQNALKLDYETKKIERKTITSAKKREIEELKFVQKQEKKKLKKRGY